MKIEDIIKSTVPLDIAKKVILNFTYTQNVIADKFHELLKPYDLSREQYNVLRILRGQKGKPANMCIIQERMLAKNSNTTRLIDKLLVKNYVTREVCPQNRRKIEVLITQKGLDILTELDPLTLDFEQHFAKNLTEVELEQLNTLLEKYRTFKNEDTNE
jgi:DNA-binding MarR family transcriptional regulator